MAINVFPIPSTAAVTPTGWTAGVAGTFTLSSTLTVGTYLIKTDSTQSMTITLVDSGGRRYAGTIRGGSGFITVATAVNQIIIPGSLTYPFGIEITPISVTQLAAPTSLSLSFNSTTGVITGTWGTAPTGSTGAVLFTPTGSVLNFSSTASGATTTLVNTNFNPGTTNELVVAFKNSSGAIGLGATFSLSMATILTIADVLLVAGGGSGGSSVGVSQYASAWGGGAGGYRTFTSYSLPTSFTITVGAAVAGSSNAQASKGNNSSIAIYTATGGGKGGDTYPAGGSGVGGNGGSGGGGSTTGPAGTGNEGGYTPAEGTNGRTDSSGSFGNGGGSANTSGTGTSNSITGTAVTYAAGGIRGNYGSGVTPTTASLGNGGNGAAQGNTSGDGGSGVVVIAYPDTSPAITTIGAGLTYDQPTRAGYRVYRFTAGTGTVTM
jgi:hypothetical protein